MKKTCDKINLLIQTAGFYNLGNRSFSMLPYDSLCKYSHPTNKELPGCAVGRLINDTELKKKIDELDNSGVCEDETWNMLPAEVREWGQDFLGELQSLHDGVSNWNKEGLSLKGLRLFNEIKDKLTRGEFDKDNIKLISVE